MKRILFLIGLLGLSFVFLYGEGLSYESRSYDVYTLPEMYLNEGINSTQTTDITIAAPKLNGETITINGMSGAIFEFRRSGKKEDIYTSNLIVNADNTLTFSGTVIRDVCQYTEARTFTTCGNGFQFQRGNIVRLPDNHRLFNLKADIDRSNTFTGSGRITSDQTTQAWIDANCVTTTQRDAFTVVDEGNIVCNSTTGTIDTYLGGQWVQLASGTGSLQNATEVISGKVRLAGTGAIINGSGSTSPPNVLWTNYTTATGGTTKNGYIPLLNTGGLLNISMGGTGSGGHIPYALITGGTSTSAVLQSVALLGTAGQALTSNGAGALPTFQAAINLQLGAIIASSTPVGASSTGEANMNQTIILPADTFSAAGDTIHIKVSGGHRLDSGRVDLNLKLGSTSMGLFTASAATGSDDHGWSGDFWITARTVGATASLIAGGKAIFADSAPSILINALTGDPTIPKTIDTTGTLTLQISAQFSASDAEHQCDLDTLISFKTSG